MLFGDTDVLTPYPELGGDPTHYDPDFRAKIAWELGEDISRTDLPPELATNRALHRHAKFIGRLRNNEDDALALYRAYPDNGLVLNWASCNNGSQTRYYLDALLLTKQPISVIAADVGVTEAQVKLYEELYFSCRESKAHRNLLPARTKTALALGPLLELPRNAPVQTQWRLAAVQLGYTALIDRWGWQEDAHGEHEDFATMRQNLRVAALQVQQRLRAGVFSNEELFGVISGCMEYERLLIEQEDKGHSQQRGMDLIQMVLQAMAPKLVSVAAEQDGLDAAEQASYKKLLAEHNISLQDIDDKGAMAAWTPVNDQLRARFQGIKA
jgi:hypothetical protein